MINNNQKINIVSGEGEQGTIEPYTGKMTRRALEAKLTKERCGGDRWAHAEWENGEKITGDC